MVGQQYHKEESNSIVFEYELVDAILILINKISYGRIDKIKIQSIRD